MSEHAELIGRLVIMSVAQLAATNPESLPVFLGMLMESPGIKPFTSEPGFKRGMELAASELITSRGDRLLFAKVQRVSQA